MKENNSSEWNVPVMICFPTNGTAAVVLLNECHFVVMRAESSGRPISQYGTCGRGFIASVLLLSFQITATLVHCSGSLTIVPPR